MRLALVPRNTEFYALFTEAGENALTAARLVERRVREFPDTDVTQEQIKALEHEGDRITSEIIRLLNTQYVTPFDREDIYAIASAFDDIVDAIDNASDLLGLYKVEAAMDQVTQQVRVLVAAVENLSHAVANLQSLKGVQRYLLEVDRLEDEADYIVRDAITTLFEDEDVSPREIIRWKDIFEACEEAVDACETATNRLGNVVVKNV